jgi:hypothetical protein
MNTFKQEEDAEVEASRPSIGRKTVPRIANSSGRIFLNYAQG